MEPPDFEKIADRFWGSVRQTTTPPETWPAEFRREMADLLRQVWNARGEADLTTVAEAAAREIQTHALDGLGPDARTRVLGPYVTALYCALRMLDR